MKYRIVHVKDLCLEHNVRQEIFVVVAAVEGAIAIVAIVP